MLDLTLRRAPLADDPTLERWDREPHVIAATTDAPDVEKVFGDHDWRSEIPKQSKVDKFLIPELRGWSIGAIQIIDAPTSPRTTGASLSRTCVRSTSGSAMPPTTARGTARQ